MDDVDKARLRKLDVNVLLVFLGLMEHRKAASVARALDVTQSTVSHALGRLRDVFDDRLFLRSGGGLTPTSLALAIEPHVRASVEALDLALAGPPAFDPRRSGATLRVSALDHTMATLLPPFARRVDEAGSDLQLSIRSLPRDAAIKAFADDGLDLAVGFFWDVPPMLMRQTLRHDAYLVVGRAGHPLLGGALTLDAYCGARHLNVSPDGAMQGVIDDALRAIGRRRRNVIAVPMFFPALTIVAETDLLATLPATMVRRYAALFDLESAEPPVELGRIEMSVVRHRRDEKNGMIDWAVAVLRDVCADAE